MRTLIEQLLNQGDARDIGESDLGKIELQAITRRKYLRDILAEHRQPRFAEGTFKLEQGRIPIVLSGDS